MRGLVQGTALAFSFGASVATASTQTSPAATLNASRSMLANAPFQDDYPTDESAAVLRDELFFQRAVQVYLWSLPAVSIYAMKEGSEKTYGVGYNVLPVWKERLNAQTKVTTPNSDCLYAMGYVNIAKDGPIVVEVPPKNQGILDDFFQRPLTGPTIDGKTFTGDFGFVGPDGGKGGKYLIVPWNYHGSIPKGFYVYRSRTNNVFVFYRGFFSDPKDLAPPNQLIAGTRIYPLGKQSTAKPMAFSRRFQDARIHALSARWHVLRHACPFRG